MKKLVIIGNGCFAKLVDFYVSTYSEYSVVAFSVDELFITEKEFCKRPCLAFEKIMEYFPPDKVSVLVAIGYSKMNSIREEKFKKCEKMGYDMPSFIHPQAFIAPNAKIGKGNIIMEGVIVQPFSEIGNGNILMSNALIAHDTVLRDFNTVSVSSTVAGFVNIGNNCFIGANATIRDHISVLDFTLVGAGAYLYKSSEGNEIIFENGKKKKMNDIKKKNEFLKEKVASRILKEEESFPKVFGLDTVSYCNLKCVMCSHKTMKRKPGFMSEKLYKKIIDEIAEKRPDAQIWITFFGEGAISKDLPDKISYAREKGLSDIRFNSNATLLTKEYSKRLIDAGLPTLVVGMDAVNEESYSKIRVGGGKYQDIVKNIFDYKELLDKYGKEGQRIVLQFIEMEFNKG